MFPPTVPLLRTYVRGTVPPPDYEHMFVDSYPGGYHLRCERMFARDALRTYVRGARFGARRGRGSTPYRAVLRTYVRRLERVFVALGGSRKSEPPPAEKRLIALAVHINFSPWGDDLRRPGMPAQDGQKCGHWSETTEYAIHTQLCTQYSVVSLQKRSKVKLPSKRVTTEYGYHTRYLWTLYNTNEGHNPS